MVVEKKNIKYVFGINYAPTLPVKAFTLTSEVILFSAYFFLLVKDCMNYMHTIKRVP